MRHPRTDYQRIQDPAGLIPEDEPVFLLRAQDKVAARAVRAWALYNEQEGGDNTLSQMARDYAEKMDDWPIKKLADLPAEQPVDQPTEQPAEKAAESEKRPGSGIA
ncbi:MAG: hypothetical protein WAV28_07020 [Sedimentisphaerales bacterium]